MGKFVAAKRVERIEWDFTNTPRDGGKGSVEHDQLVGTLPEPEPEAAAAFIDEYQTIVEKGLASRAHSVQRFERAEETHEVEPSDGEAKAAYLEMQQMSIRALAHVGVPQDLVEQLPVRVLGPFLNYVQAELSGKDGAAF